MSRSLDRSLELRRGPSARASRALVVAALASGLLAVTEVRAESGDASATKSAPIVLDRVVVRFSAPEGGGLERPFFIYERELAFEARLAALADPAHRATTEPYRRHHIQNALERHVAETLLAALAIEPAPTSQQIADQVAAARKMAEDEVGGSQALLVAARAEGLGSLELRRYFRRRALASLYLHAMVAPMLTPSALQLRRAHRDGVGPLSERPFEEAEPALRSWYVTRSLRAAVATYFQNARARVRLSYMD